MIKKGRLRPSKGLALSEADRFCSLASRWWFTPLAFPRLVWNSAAEP